MAAPSPFKFGYYYDDDADKADKNEPQFYEGERHILLFGVNGAGKSTRILIENLVMMRNRSLVIFDMKGELAAQTIRARLQLGDVKLVNPYNVFEMGSDGYNPLALLDPDHDEFFDQAKELAVAMVESEGEKNQFFSQTARGWFCGSIMWEVVQARAEQRPASLLKAREWCLQPDMWGPGPDGKDVLVKGVTINARKMVEQGGRQIANLATRFARDQLNRSDQDVLSTLATETEFLISNPIARDLEKGDWSFAQLKQTPTAVYIVLPPNQVNDKRRWTRMLITAALCDHLRPGPVKTLFILDEFRVSIGHLQIVNDFWALVRGYGVQFLPVCQSVLQLRALFKDEWENYAGQAGVVATIGPPGDTVTAEWMSKRSGNRTIWQQGWSEGEGTGGQGISTSLGETRSQAERAFMLPQEIMSMKIGTGRIWPSGHGDISIPFFAPNYWQRGEIKGLVDDNPYFKGIAVVDDIEKMRAAAFWERVPWPVMVYKWAITHLPPPLAKVIGPYAVKHQWADKLFRAFPLRPLSPEVWPPAKLNLDEVKEVFAGLAKASLVFVFGLAVMTYGPDLLRAARPWVAEYAPSLVVYVDAIAPPPPVLNAHPMGHPVGRAAGRN